MKELFIASLDTQRAFDVVKPRTDTVASLVDSCVRHAPGYHLIHYRMSFFQVNPDMQWFLSRFWGMVSRPREMLLGLGSIRGAWVQNA